MAYALGYDSKDFESDEEDLEAPKKSTVHGNGSRRGNEQPLPTPIDMDKLDTPTLERLEWLEPLGYRALSHVTGFPPATLRKHFWASKVKSTSTLYSDVNYYFTNSHSQSHRATMRIKQLVELKRYNENNCDYKVPNVQLLWHGTQTANVGGILTNGFRLPTSQGMFGRGVYFADRVTKSAQYCRCGAGPGSSGVLFLCAVNLGRMYETTSAMGTLVAPPHGHDSVKGCGKNIPDSTDVRYHRGASIPCGRTLQQSGVGGLIHNEYIVYDLSKIAILFLVEFEYL